MRVAELEDIRALLRAQAEAEPPEPERKGMFGGLLKKKGPKRGPLNLTPVAPPPPRPVQTRAPEPEPLDLVIEAPAPEERVPFVAPKRKTFGLADEGAQPVVPELRLKSRMILDEEVPIDVWPRRKGASLAAIEAAGVGADEIIELHDMLSERMPQLLSQIDLEAKLETPDADEPAIADVVGALEAIRASVERDASVEAWAEASAGLSALQSDASHGAVARRLRLVPLAQELETQHAELEGDLAAVRRARTRWDERTAA